MTQTSKPYCYEYPRPAVTVDVVIVTRERPQQVLLIQRKHDPFAGHWALPGGFLDMDETLEAAARRELSEETGVQIEKLAQLCIQDAPGRDPRGRVISVVFLAQLEAATIAPRAADDAAALSWFRWSQLPALAFDHGEVLARAKAHLRRARS